MALGWRFNILKVAKIRKKICHCEPTKEAWQPSVIKVKYYKGTLQNGDCHPVRTGLNDVMINLVSCNYSSSLP
jgi:hypothetical protein